MTSVLPSKPSLEQLKKQAKDLVSAHGNRSADCLQILRHLHQFKDSTDQSVFSAPLQLADAQFALAIEYGFATWGELLQHLEDRNLGLGDRAARAWGRLRKNAELARIIGGEPKSIVDVWAVFPTLEITGPQGRFKAEEADPDSAGRLVREQRLGEFLNACGVEAPRITILEADSHTYAVHRMIEGVPVDSVDLSAGELEVVAGQLAGLLNRLHAVPLADACRILGWPAMTPEVAAKQCRYGGYLEVDVIEANMATELAADKAAMDLWRETREWITSFVSTPADLVFGHGDLWLSEALMTKTPEGYRLSGVTHLINAGMMNLYDEFLRVGGLGLYDGEGDRVGRAVIEAYNRIPGQTRRVEEAPLRHAITAFWFYLAAEPGNKKRLEWLANAKKTQRGG